MYDIENYTHHGLTIRIVPDDTDDSPRDWDNLGHMVCWHPRYNLGDMQVQLGPYYSIDEFLTELVEDHDPTVILPLYLLDHSGITMKAGAPIDRTKFTPQGDVFIADPGGWDSSFVGFILDTSETRKMMGHEVPTNIARVGIENILRSEVETYATFLEGGVVGWIVEDEHGNHLDSCFGYYELGHCKEEANNVAEHAAVELAEQRTADLVIIRAAQNLYADVNIRVHTGAMIVEIENGYWVAAEVFLPKENT